MSPPPSTAWGRSNGAFSDIREGAPRAASRSPLVESLPESSLTKTPNRMSTEISPKEMIPMTWNSVAKVQRHASLITPLCLGKRTELEHKRFVPLALLFLIARRYWKSNRHFRVRIVILTRELQN